MSTVSSGWWPRKSPWRKRRMTRTGRRMPQLCGASRTRILSGPPAAGKRSIACGLILARVGADVFAVVQALEVDSRSSLVGGGESSVEIRARSGDPQDAPSTGHDLIAFALRPSVENLRSGNLLGSAQPSDGLAGFKLSGVAPGRENHAYARAGSPPELGGIEATRGDISQHLCEVEVHARNDGLRFWVT